MHITYILHFTWTANSCIFRMITIMYLKSVVGTVKETRFISTALNITEGDVSRALSIAAPRGSGLSIPVPHAPTENLCVIHVPFIITHGSPSSVVKHLHTTLPVRATTDQLCICWQKEKKKVDWLGYRHWMWYWWQKVLAVILLEENRFHDVLQHGVFR